MKERKHEAPPAGSGGGKQSAAQSTGAERRGHRDLKKIRRHTFQTIEDKYRFIQSASAGVSVDQLYRLLEISRSGYYAWLHRGISPRKQQDQRLSRQLITLHQQQPASGLDTLFHMIRRKMVCSRKRIYRLMRQLHIQSARKFAYKRTTNSRHSHSVAPNLLNRNFQVDKPNTVWVGNISVTALHRFIPQPASGRSPTLPCLDCIFSMVRILAIIAFFHTLFMGKIAWIHQILVSNFLSAPPPLSY